MPRSLKKGPFVDHHLMKKVEDRGQQQEADQDLVASLDDPAGNGRLTRIAVHNGKNHIPVLVNENMVGHKLGEFALTRTFKGHGGDKKSGRSKEMTMEAKAILRSARISPQKARLVADQVRGLSAERAVNLLKFSDKKAAHMIRKVVESAIANAENNQGADVDELKVTTIMVDEGPSLKRFMARAKGRGTRILKRTSHITVVVGEGK